MSQLCHYGRCNRYLGTTFYLREALVTELCALPVKAEDMNNL
jgi:hypothetical protein